MVRILALILSQDPFNHWFMFTVRSSSVCAHKIKEQVGDKSKLREFAGHVMIFIPVSQ